MKKGPHKNHKSESSLVRRFSQMPGEPWVEKPSVVDSKRQEVRNKVEKVLSSGEDDLDRIRSEKISMTVLSEQLEVQPTQDRVFYFQEKALGCGLKNISVFYNHKDQNLKLRLLRKDGSSFDVSGVPNDFQLTVFSGQVFLNGESIARVSNQVHFQDLNPAADWKSRFGAPGWDKSGIRSRF